MIVSKIETQKRNALRVNVFEGKKYKFSLNLETAYEFDVKEGVDLSEELIIKALTKDLTSFYSQRFFKYLAKYRKTVIESERYLLNKFKNHFNENAEENVEGEDEYDIDYNAIVENLLTQAKDIGLLNDELYAKDFISDRIRYKSKSNQIIKYELLRKGIDVSIIESLLTKVEVSEFDRAIAILNKKYKSAVLTNRDDKKIRFLASRGFSYDIISKLFQNEHS